MKYPRSILVPLDLSEYSFTALAYASEIGGLFPDAKISVLCVHDVTEDEAEKEIDADLVDKTRASITRLMIEKQISQANISILVRHGKPACTIVRTAKETGTDLIVMCTHGRTGLDHLLAGSVAEKVVRGAHCPGLTIKPDAFQELVALSEEDVAGCLHMQSSP